MKRVFSYLILYVSVSAAILALSPAVNAIPINITVDSGGALLNGSGVAKSSEYDALHGLSPSNNNPGRNLAFLNALIQNWNGAFDPNLNAAVPPVALNDGSLGDVSSYTAPAGYQYVVFHFGAGRAGGQGVSPGGWWQAWYLGGDGGTFALPQVGPKSVGGFSSARFFNSVPEAGATLPLLAGALLVLVAINSRRRFTGILAGRESTAAATAA